MYTLDEIVKKTLEINGYDKLNPMQEIAKKYIGTNTLITTPTASGKTTVFEMYMLECLLNRKKKVVYISPLKALTTEHYLETKRKFSKELDIKIALSIGDLDQSEKHLQENDVLFLTYEKFDSIIRRQPAWIGEIGLLTIDEIHELGSDRGATLEVIITQLKYNFEKMIILGLSATIKNSKEIADWLSAKLVLSSYRPVPLEIGVFCEDNIYFEDRKENLTSLAVKNNPIGSIIEDTLKKEKQAIVFCNSRNNAMSNATKYGKIIKDKLKKEEYLELRKASKEILDALENPSKQCELLSNALLEGAAFHHAGLVHAQRTVVEDYFKKGHIKVIFATPTLAAGINLPAFRVIINNVFRYQHGGMEPIPVNEFQQMAGRAGRPRYDVRGEAICVVNSQDKISKIYKTYIQSGPTDIYSQLSKINILRMHLLSMVLINKLTSLEEVMTYLSKSFYYFVYGNNSEIRDTVKEIIEEFMAHEFLEKEQKGFKITPLGKIVCYLYIDPLSANNILKDVAKKKGKETKIYEKLFTIVNTAEMKNHVAQKYNDEKELQVFLKEIEKNIYYDSEDIYIYNKLNLTKIIYDWIEEKDENYIIEKYKTSPGQIREIISKAEWMTHATVELMKHKKGDAENIIEYTTLLLRIKYGIKQELVELIEIKNIGRVRARKLYNKGIRSEEDIKKNPEKFIEVVGRYGYEELKKLKLEHLIKREW